MRETLIAVTILSFIACAHGAFAQTTAPAQPQADPGTSAPPSAAPAPIPAPPAPAAPAAQPAPQATVSAPPPTPMKQMRVSDLVEKDLERFQAIPVRILLRRSSWRIERA